MGFSRREYWSGLPFPSPGDLPDSIIYTGAQILGLINIKSVFQGSQYKQYDITD